MAITRAQFLKFLLGGISPNFYDTWVKSDSLVRIFLDTYANELASGSVQLDELREDLSLMLVSGSQIYDNFGTYVGPDKHYNQYQASNVLETEGSNPEWKRPIISYRQQTHFLWRAGLEGSTMQGLYNVGYAYAGVTPKVDEARFIPRWKLSVDSVVPSGSASGSLTITDTSKSWFVDEWEYAIFGSGTEVKSNTRNTLTLKSEIPGNDSILKELVTKQAELAAGTITQDEYNTWLSRYLAVTFTKLGTNTKLYGKKEKYSDVTITAFVPGVIYDDADRKTQITQSFEDYVPAGCKLTVNFSKTYVGYGTRDQFGGFSFDSSYFSVDGDSVTNTRQVKTS